MRFDMRLYKWQYNLLQSLAKTINWDLYLFWSRVYDDKKGWDIDILIINKSDKDNLKLSLEVEREFFKQYEQKIDVVVFNENMTREQRLFFDSIKKQKIWQI